MKYNFNKNYEKNDVNTTFRYPFEVPEHTEKIEVHIQTSQDKKPQIYKDNRQDMLGVGISYNGVIRSWNCCHKKYLLLAEDYVLPGSIPGVIEGGTWELVVFPRTKNELTKINLEVNIEITKEHHRFVKGDNHLHTVHSDGSISIDRVAECSKEAGLDYIFITDHNISSANYNLPKDKGILIAPGIEYGVEAGHMNILGDMTPVGDFTWDPDSKCYGKVFDQIKGSSLGIGVNHPFCHDSPWLLDLGWDFDWVEIWNGMWRPVNDRAVRWWHEELCKGRKIPIIGGSDTHGDDSPIIKHGVPTTHAYVKKMSPQHIIDAYKAGHCFITLTALSPRITMTTEHHMMGDTTKDQEVAIHLENLHEGDCIRIISDQGMVEYEAKKEVFDECFMRLSEKFVRVQVLRLMNAKEQVDFLDYEVWGTELLSNPIYFE